ncbi:MAG: hypothetical protein KAS75_00780 [Planctomycetes bacterium]|nr:hypothetical protein [Planctomycetota bacterium]
MRKIAFLLAVLLISVPALATVTITATQIGSTNQVAITYVASSEPNLVRAFGLDITVTAGTIEGISDYNTGECDSVNKGYGIFPGNIDVNTSDGSINDACSPVAPSDDPGALGGLGTSGITIEMGSLYVDANAPGNSGTLCILTLGLCPSETSATVNIAENTARGGVVLEDPSQDPTVNTVPGAVTVSCECYIGPDLTEWRAVGSPDSWCYDRQCHGDASGSTETIGKGTFHVGYVDLGIFIDGWTDGGSDVNVMASDFTHSSETIGKGTFRVGYEDLDVFIGFWTDSPMPDPNCNE